MGRLETQQNNRRNNHYVSVDGQVMSLMEFSEKYPLPPSVDYNTIQNRITKYHYDINKAIQTPNRKTKLPCPVHFDYNIKDLGIHNVNDQNDFNCPVSFLKTRKQVNDIVNKANEELKRYYG